VTKLIELDVVVEVGDRAETQVDVALARTSSSVSEWRASWHASLSHLSCETSAIESHAFLAAVRDSAVHSDELESCAVTEAMAASAITAVNDLMVTMGSGGRGLRVSWKLARDWSHGGRFGQREASLSCTCTAVKKAAAVGQVSSVQLG
jgi:hypothetical protein